MDYRGPRRRERERTENLFEEIIAENFPNLGNETGMQVQEAQRVPNKNSKRSMPRHIIIKMANVKEKERIFKAVREKQPVTFKETPIR